MPEKHGYTSPSATAQRAWGYSDDERAYIEWMHCFVAQLRRRIPDAPSHEINEAADNWSHHCDKVPPEDAAEIAAMWWRRS